MHGQGNSLFSSGSLILVEEPDFLIRKYDDNKLESLMKYVSNPIYETDLIFYTYNNNFNTRLKAYKTIHDNAQLINLNTLDYKNFNNYVKSRINEEKLNINSEALFALNNMCKRSATLFERNCILNRLL